MQAIIELLFEARHLKKITRSGFGFLGVGHESVAEHTFHTTFIAMVMANMVPDIDKLKLISMCLIHDLPEARMGDMNYVQKKYVVADENKAINDTLAEIPFKSIFTDLMDEFNQKETLETQLAHDADQLSLLIELKDLADIGFHPPNDWVPNVEARIKTELGHKMAQEILKTPRDSWWRKKFIDSTGT
jgi:putative hydrolases of HD superfamily